jgi:hypothetical protein
MGVSRPVGRVQSPGHQKADTMSHDKIKAAVRRRMAQTGESYTTARHEVIKHYRASQRDVASFHSPSLAAMLPDLDKLSAAMFRAVMPDPDKLTQALSRSLAAMLPDPDRFSAMLPDPDRFSATYQASAADQLGAVHGPSATWPPHSRFASLHLSSDRREPVPRSPFPRR